ncbi:MAG: hypothetical protein IKO78_02530 [Bacilli bacterium]|nr:hypothetical protein [Bacilli bacterium]
MKILTNKRYKELTNYENKYRELTGQLITLYTGKRSKYSALLSMNKEELVHRYLDLNNAYIRLFKKVVDKK